MAKQKNKKLSNLKKRIGLLIAFSGGFFASGHFDAEKTHALDHTLSSIHNRQEGETWEKLASDLGVNVQELKNINEDVLPEVGEPVFKSQDEKEAFSLPLEARLEITQSALQRQAESAVENALKELPPKASKEKNIKEVAETIFDSLSQGLEKLADDEESKDNVKRLIKMKKEVISSLEKNIKEYQKKINPLTKGHSDFKIAQPAAEFGINLITEYLDKEQQGKTSKEKIKNDKKNIEKISKKSITEIQNTGKELKKINKKNYNVSAGEASEVFEGRLEKEGKNALKDEEMERKLHKSIKDADGDIAKGVEEILKSELKYKNIKVSAKTIQDLANGLTSASKDENQDPDLTEENLSRRISNLTEMFIKQKGKIPNTNKFLSEAEEKFQKQVDVLPVDGIKFFTKEVVNNLDDSKLSESNTDTLDGTLDNAEEKENINKVVQDIADDKDLILKDKDDEKAKKDEKI
jgi:hypothetical protein